MATDSSTSTEACICTCSGYKRVACEHVDACPCAFHEELRWKEKEAEDSLAAMISIIGMNAS